MKLLLLVAALALAAAPALAKPSGIVISRAWIAAPPAGALTAAAYVTIRNDARAPDALLGAATPVAEKLQLHSMSMVGGIMRMRPATDGLVIAPGATLSLIPGGGYHFMLTRPRRPLKTGDRIPATLTFAKAGAVKTVFVVEAPPNVGEGPMR